ncbi:MAG: hypothetical protein JWN41_1200 [Thermoleophilia bacterium]|nr:hypothetical protein [Thermoleophilia bacterium]
MTTAQLPTTASVGSDHFHPKNPSGTSVAVLMTGISRQIGVPAQVADLRTQLGRAEGYASLANARRAAYMLTRGEGRGAAGVYQQGSRFYVRAMGTYAATGTQLTQLRFEGTNAAIVGVQDLRLRLLVDGSTKLFATNL